MSRFLTFGWIIKAATDFRPRVIAWSLSFSWEPTFSFEISSGSTSDLGIVMLRCRLKQQVDRVAAGKDP